jgi:proline dehydrogenase
VNSSNAARGRTGRAVGEVDAAGQRKLVEALRTVEEWNRQGIAGTLSWLPFVETSRSGVAGEVERHIGMLRAIRDFGLDCDITVKGQLFGIYSSERLARHSIEQVICAARQLGLFVWMDMEQTPTVDPTIRTFSALYRRLGYCGICLQAYLKRTADDLNYLLQWGVPVRLVKGFYRDHDIAPWPEVSRNYRVLMERVLRYSRYPAIATHDVDIVDRAVFVIRRNKIRNAEFQFFNGVRDDLARRLALDGFRVRIYVPVGNVWRFLWEGLTRFDLWHQAQRMIGVAPRG